MHTVEIQNLISEALLEADHLEGYMSHVSTLLKKLATALEESN